jgi:hypothetical protein
MGNEDIVDHNQFLVEAKATPMDDMTDAKTYSICIRVKRTTVEYAYVSVLVSGEIMKRDDKGEVVNDENGHAHIDPQKLTYQAVEQARQKSVKWYGESEQIEPHPLQTPLHPTEISEKNR